MGTTYHNKPIVTDGLVFCVDPANKVSYPGSGTTATDLVGNIDGTLENSPQFESSNGGIFDFDGADDCINFGEDLFSTLTSNFTISFWAEPSGGATLKDFMAFTFGNSSIFYNSFFINFNTESIEFFINNTKIFQLQFSTDADLTNFITGWNHYDIVYTPGTTGTCKVYINNSSTSFGNGTLVANFSTAPTPNTTTGNPLKIGNPNPYSSGCKMGPVQIYNKALTQTEVSQNYNALKNRFI
jgi:hypothetical protein